MPLIGGMVDPNHGMEKVPRYETWQSNRPAATSYTLTGPTTGVNGVASTAFTVAFPSTVAGMLTVVTPADAGTGNAGVFTPSSIRLTDTDRSGTFTYTPSTGAKTISVTNASERDGGNLTNRNLTNPANLTYTST